MPSRPPVAGRRWPALLAPLLLLAAAAAPCRADFVISILPVTVAAGSTGNAFDVVLTNTGPSSASVGGFSFGLSSAAGLTFTSVTTATAAPYVFGTLGLFGPDITSAPPPPGVAILAGDVYSVPGTGVTLASGAVVGLGHVFFNVAAGASGSIAVVLSASPITSLSTAAGVNIPITRLDTGSVTIQSGPAVPEPGSCLLLGIGLAGAVGLARRARNC